jgi:N6-L-threonylcarbamoyladenine synthase
VLVLGIETSCDETSAAVVENGRRALSNVISSQVDVHVRFGGVVPELASRNHLLQALPVIDAALAEAGVGLAQLDGLAVTAGPGLAGALLVGVQTAKGLAFGSGLPLVGVHHLAGHLHAIRLTDRAPDLPFLGLAVSGGHTSLYAVEACTKGLRYRLLGGTLDDAAGEAFDKVAKMLGLPYPGGVQIDRLARTGSPTAHHFPRALLGKGLDFSFSGLKTSVLLHVQKHGRPEGQALADLCASFQEAIVDVLTQKALVAAAQEGIRSLVLCGGVAANSRLRAVFDERAQAAGLATFVPPPRLCTDNAAMIAVAGTYLLERGERAGFELDANPAAQLQ